MTRLRSIWGAYGCLITSCGMVLVTNVAAMATNSLWGPATRPSDWTDDARARAAKLDRRAENGDVEAVRQIAELPPEMATRKLASRLRFYSWDQNNKAMPGFLGASASAITRVDGYIDFFRKRIDQLTSEIGTASKRAILIGILGDIGSEPAIDLLAKLALDRRMAESEEYLTNFFESKEPGDDSFPDYSPNSPIAIRTLGRMNLPDAPKTDKPYYHYGLKEMELWEDWAKARLENKKKAVGASTNRPSLAENGADRESPDPRHLRTFLLVALVLLLVAISVGMAMGGRKNA